MVLSCSSCSAVSGPGSFMSSVPVKPMIAFRGVRSSWLMPARKLSLDMARTLELNGFLLQHALDALAIRHVANGREHEQLAIGPRRAETDFNRDLRTVLLEAMEFQPDTHRTRMRIRGEAAALRHVT